MIDYGNMTMEEITDEVLEGASPSEIEQEIRESGKFSDFTSKSVRYRDESKTVSPHTVDVTGPAPRALDRVHANRSAREQTVDEQYNAPVTLDEEQWVENKNRLDYPGVDTVPGGALAARAETAATRVQERGAVDRVEHKGSAKNLQGKFSPKGTKTYGREDTVVRVQGTASQPERTLAHERCPTVGRST